MLMITEKLLCPELVCTGELFKSLSRCCLLVFLQEQRRHCSPGARLLPISSRTNLLPCLEQKTNPPLQTPHENRREENGLDLLSFYCKIISLP